MWSECCHREQRLDNEKACQNSDVPTKIVKENADIFA